MICLSFCVSFYSLKNFEIIPFFCTFLLLEKMYRSTFLLPFRGLQNYSIFFVSSFFQPCRLTNHGTRTWMHSPGWGSPTHPRDQISIFCLKHPVSTCARTFVFANDASWLRLLTATMLGRISGFLRLRGRFQMESTTPSTHGIRRRCGDCLAACLRRVGINYGSSSGKSSFYLTFPSNIHSVLTELMRPCWDQITTPLTKSNASKAATSKHLSFLKTVKCQDITSDKMKTALRIWFQNRVV